MSETEVPLFSNLMRPCYLTIFHELTTDLTVQGRDFGFVILHVTADKKKSPRTVSYSPISFYFPLFSIQPFYQHLPSAWPQPELNLRQKTLPLCQKTHKNLQKRDQCN